MMIRIGVIVIFVCLMALGCQKKRYEPIPNDIGHSYLPLKTGDIFIYKADSILYGFLGTKPNGDSISFFIKEEVTYQLKDSNLTVYTLSRYHSKDSTHWQFAKNHFYEVENLRINHKENNSISTALIFPILKNTYWNGHRFNNLAPKDYEYSMVNYSLKLNNTIYTNCVKVKMDSTLNFLQNIMASNVYSKDCGLVFSESKNLLLINNDSLDKDGHVVLQRPPKIAKGTVFTKSLLYKR